MPLRKVPVVLRELTGVEVMPSALTQDARRRAAGSVGAVYEQLTSHAGTVLLHDFPQGLGVERLLDEELSVKTRERGYGEGQAIGGLVYNLVVKSPGSCKQVRQQTQHFAGVEGWWGKPPPSVHPVGVVAVSCEVVVQIH
ncbi:MAG: hypothetical protein HY268_33830 [Deltaproteobacteria bacterium]|nr:hypothetical protein [Deltaproteobacteria bacterium]